MTLLTDLVGRIRGRDPCSAKLTRLDLAEGPVYAVGDVHGCRMLLRGLDAMIESDSAQFGKRAHIVLLGDMVDRGPDTAGLMDDLLRPLTWATRLAVRGNHEEMMLSFLKDPARNAVWLEQGGYETLRSYGLALHTNDLLALPRRRLGQMLSAHLPEYHLAWLRALPAGFVVSLNGQDWVLAHAGFDPDRSVDDQPETALVWGARVPGPGAAIGLVHGHVIQTVVQSVGTCIGIDTGAYKTGVLTALRFAEGEAVCVLSYATPSGSPRSPFIC